MQDLQKIIVALVAILLGSWALFGFLVKRWLDGTDNSIRELYDRTNDDRNELAKIKAICGERHK